MTDDSSIYKPPVGFYFKLAFSGVPNQNDASFQEASGLSAEIETREASEGGENQFKYRQPQSGNYSNLVLKRGILVQGSELANWCQETIGGNFEKPIQPKTITVSLLNPNSSKESPLKSWDFINAYPVKWSISDLKSQDNALVVETLEFAYNYFEQKSS